MVKGICDNEKGVKNMGLRDLENVTNAVTRKGVSGSPIVQQDINNIFAINNLLDILF